MHRIKLNTNIFVDHDEVEVRQVLKLAHTDFKIKPLPNTFV
jgi:hypothetical protein